MNTGIARLEIELAQKLCEYRLVGKLDRDNPDWGMRLVDALSVGDDTGKEEICGIVDMILGVVLGHAKDVTKAAKEVGYEP